MVAWLTSLDALDPENADENGLVALGGYLDPDLLLVAYRVGTFPWSSDPVVTWWSPDPRAIFELETFREHRSVRRSARQWRLSLDEDFLGVMRGCAASAPGREETWITADFVKAYGELHRRGWAHSVEVWEEDELVGGIYGVSIGAYFGAESMFHRRTDASKAALGHLAKLLQRGGYQLFDAQVPSPHLMRMGAIALPRADYLERLRRAIATPAQWGSPGEPG